MAVIFDHDALVMENGMFFTIVIDFNPQLFDQTVALVAVVEPQIYVAAFAVLRPGVVNAEAQPFQKDRTDAVRRALSVRVRQGSVGHGASRWLPNSGPNGF